LSYEHASDSAGGEVNLAPGVAPSFGEVPDSPFEHTPERLVLSLSEHEHLAGLAFAETLEGTFESERLGSGTLLLRNGDSPGAIHLSADVLGPSGPAMRLDATVRESWLLRSVSGGAEETARVQVVRELVRLASLPHQSTVRVSIAAD